MSAAELQSHVSGLTKGGGRASVCYRSVERMELILQKNIGSVKNKTSKQPTKQPIQQQQQQCLLSSSWALVEHEMRICLPLKDFKRGFFVRVIRMLTSGLSSAPLYIKTNRLSSGIKPDLSLIRHSERSRQHLMERGKHCSGASLECHFIFYHRIPHLWVRCETLQPELSLAQLALESSTCWTCSLQVCSLRKSCCCWKTVSVVLVTEDMNNKQKTCGRLFLC